MSVAQLTGSLRKPTEVTHMHLCIFRCLHKPYCETCKIVHRSHMCFQIRRYAEGVVLHFGYCGFSDVCILVPSVGGPALISPAFMSSSCGASAYASLPHAACGVFQLLVLPPACPSHAAASQHNAPAATHLVNAMCSHCLCPSRSTCAGGGLPLCTRPLCKSVCAWRQGRYCNVRCWCAHGHPASLTCCKILAVPYKQSE